MPLKRQPCGAICRKSNRPRKNRRLFGLVKVEQTALAVSKHFLAIRNTFWDGLKLTETWLPLLAGLVLLVAGGELLVRGAVQIAERLGVSPLVIGLTLVGFGTSTPELVTSVNAALAGSPGIAYGNVVGSNIANILLIAGLSAIIFPLAIASSALKRDAVIMVMVTVVFAAISSVMPMGRIVGFAFLLALAAYMFLACRQERQATADHGAAYEKAAALEAADPAIAPGRKRDAAFLRPSLITIAGLALVIIGGTLLVSGAVALARAFSVSETIIGLTIVAVGTSLPELVTSIIAAFRRQGDVAFGNIVGSNIYNILGIAGATALIAPGPVPPQIIGFDNYLMIGASVLLFVFAATSLKIARWEGAVLLSGYCLYIYLLWP